MSRHRREAFSLKRAEPLPLPSSLAQAFEEIEQLDARHPEARGFNYGAIRQHESRCHRVGNRSGMAQQWPIR